MSSEKTILITGATGRQGGAVISALLASQPNPPINIIAVTRSVHTPSAHSLASKPNVTVIEGDIDNPAAIFSTANCPIWGVYSVQINSDSEETQGKALIDAALSHRVQHFVYSSGDRGGPEKSAVEATNVKNFRAKFMIEKYLEGRASASAGKMTYTILRPATFMENHTNDIHGTGFARMWQQIGPSKKLQFVSSQDIGWFAAQAFLQPEDKLYQNAALSLAGDELSQEEADKVFREVVGYSMPMAPCLVGSTLKWAMKGTLGDMFQWFKEVGYGADVEMCRRLKTDMLDYRQWLRERSGFMQR